MMFSDGGETCMCGNDDLSALAKSIQTCKSCKLHVNPNRDIYSLHPLQEESMSMEGTETPVKGFEKTEEDELVQAADSSMQLSNCLEGQSEEPHSSEEGLKKEKTEPMQDEETPDMQGKEEAMQVNDDIQDCPDANSEEEVSILGSDAASVSGSTPEKGEASSKPENENIGEFLENEVQ